MVCFDFLNPEPRTAEPSLDLLHHPHPSPALGPLALHVGLDQEHAPAAALVEVFFGGGVGDAVAREALALVLDRDFGTLGRDLRLDEDLLAGIQLVAVLDGV